MGFEADATIEAWVKLGNKLDGIDRRMRQYIEGRQVIARDAFGSGAIANPAVVPFAIDLGSPASGLIWLAGQAVIWATTPGTIIANVNGYVGKGKVPQAGSDGGASDVVGTFSSLPATVSLRKVVCSNGNDHLYVVFLGAGAVAGLQVFATAAVFEAVDNPATLSWL